MKQFLIIIISIVNLTSVIAQGHYDQKIRTLSVPTDITLTDQYVYRNQPIGTTVGILNAIDDDFGDHFIFTLITGNGSNDIDNNKFYIYEDKLNTAIVFDNDASYPLYIFIQVEDSQNNTFSKAFEIYLDRYEGPYSMALSNTIIDEITPTDTYIGKFSTIDDDDTIFTYKLVNGDGINDFDNDKFYIRNDSLFANENITITEEDILHIYAETKEKESILINENYSTIEDIEHALDLLYSMLSISSDEELTSFYDLYYMGVDPGICNYLRLYWYLQELTTDEAVIAWNDGTLPNVCQQTWDNNDIFILIFNRLLYYHIYFCNEFILHCNNFTKENIELNLSQKDQIDIYRAEARFLRALAYWHALDMFVEVPLLTEEYGTGDELPAPSTNNEIFSFIETELLAILSDLPESGTNEYGRIDKVAAWMLLAKLYLNAEVYIGQPKYTECLTYTNYVIASTYQIDDDYQNLFLADNFNSNEIIFPIVYNGIETNTYGGVTFIIHAAVGGNMNPDDYGIDGGWGGTRCTSKLPLKYGSNITDDSRAMFFTDGQSIEVTDFFNFHSGYAIEKFKNITSTGQNGSHPSFVDTDFPMFRVSDAYLMYAESILRGGIGGNINQAVNYINELRLRAYGDNSGNILSTDLTLDFILDERARELYWECHRRTDLIRYNRFTGGDYLWEWKGGVQEGTATSEEFNLFPFSDHYLPYNTFRKGFNISSIPLSLNHINNSNIKVYPNPAGTFVIVECSKMKVERIDISDIAGKSYYTSINQHNNESTYQIDLSNFAKGIYVLSVQTESGVFTTKIIKQ